MRITIDTTPNERREAMAAIEAVIAFANNSPNTSRLLGIDAKRLSYLEGFLFKVKQSRTHTRAKGERVGDK